MATTTRNEIPERLKNAVRFWLDINPYYADPVTNEVVKNPNFWTHYEAERDNGWYMTFDEAQQKCDALRALDGTFADVSGR